MSLIRSIQLSFYFYDWEGRSEILETLKTCQESIFRKRLVSFDYTDKEGAVTNRMVQPYELHFSESRWYLKGYCLHRQGIEHSSYLGSIILLWMNARFIL